MLCGTNHQVSQENSPRAANRTLFWLGRCKHSNASHSKRHLTSSVEYQKNQIDLSIKEAVLSSKRLRDKAQLIHE